MRTTTTLIGLLVVGSLVACSDGSDDTADTDAPTTETEAPADTDAPVVTPADDWSAVCGAYEGEPDEVAQVDDICAVATAFMEAINTYDTEALLAVTTEDFTYQTTGDPFTRDEFVPYFEANYERGNFQVAPTGPAEILGVAGFATYEIAEPGEVTSQDYNATGVSTYIVTGIDTDGQWLVSEFVWTEDQ